MPVARGREAIRRAWTDGLAMPGLAIQWEPTRIDVAESGDLAYVMGTYRMGADMPGGRLDDRGNYMVIWKRIDGQWRAIADIGASEVPVTRLAELAMPKRQEAAGEIAMAEPAPAPAAHFHARELKWQDGPPSLPPGAKIAMLEGDPAKPGPFTFRVKLPSGYRIPPHFHPVIEHVTVVSGAFSIGQGERWDDGKLVRLATGDFMHMPPGTRHFAVATGETEIQLHSTGPWGITYVNPADDPRK
jgi:mannose-6-phosphate isomerase-like protein (cupin superfamily)